MEIHSITAAQEDVLREIGNIGAGNAATSLSILLNQKIDMQVPTVNIVSYDEIMDLIGGPEAVIAALLFRIEGKAPGTVYLIFSLEEAEYLVGQLTGEAGFSFFAESEKSDFAVSAFKEIGNIVTGSYLTALSDLTGINMQPSIPHLGIDMAGAILTAGLLEFSKTGDSIIVIDTEVSRSVSGQGIRGNLFLLPDKEAFANIFKALGIKAYE